MNKFSKIVKGVGFSLSLLISSSLYGSESSDVSHLTAFINEIKDQSVKLGQVEGLLNAKSLDEKINICRAVKEHKDFLVFAKTSGLGNLKSLKLSETCLSFQPPKQQTLPGQLEEGRYPKPGDEHKSAQQTVGKLPTQPTAASSTPSEATSSPHKLPAQKIVIPAEFLKAEHNQSTHDALESTKKTVAAVEMQMKEHAAQLDQGDRERIEKQLVEAKANLTKAEEGYNLMGLTVDQLREEVLSAHRTQGAFKNFNPLAQASKTHEEYLTEVLKHEADLRHVKTLQRGQDFVDQFEGAKKLLDECKNDLEHARRSLEDIGR